jgi:hypothetical protein
MFLLPVKKANGFFNLVLQNQDKSFIYTFLEDYKNDPSTATPYLVVTLFDELSFSKGLVLVRGDIIGDLTVAESEKLFLMTKEFYSIEHLNKKVIDFNKNSRKFDVNAHLNMCLDKYFNDENTNKEENNQKTTFSVLSDKPKIKIKQGDAGVNPTLTTFNINKKH